MLGPKVENPIYKCHQVQREQKIMFRNKRTIKIRKNKTNKSFFCSITPHMDIHSCSLHINNNQRLSLGIFFKFLPPHWLVWRTKNIHYTNSSRPNLFFAILVLLQKNRGHASNGTLTFSPYYLEARSKRNQNYSNAREGPIW